MGGTLRAWTLSAADDALIVTVDMEGGRFGGAAFYRRSHLETFAEADQRLVFVEGDSHSAETKAAILDQLEDREVDFLFIDGDHSYEGVTQDFEDYADLVRDGGVIALHDTEAQPEDPTVEVHRFWPELEREYEPDTERFRTEGSYAGCGIGVIHW
jgi:predicted O-methyltransferase YrrM